MFRSFFPRPGLFFLSALVWSTFSIVVWYLFGDALGTLLGFPAPVTDADPVIGLGYFVTPHFIWFYLYYALVTIGFTIFWFVTDPHPWRWWSIPGSSLILFST